MMNRSDIVYSTRWGSSLKFPPVYETEDQDNIAELPDYEYYPMLLTNNPEIASILHTLRKLSSVVDEPNISVTRKRSMSQSLYITERLILILEPTLIHLENEIHLLESNILHAFVVAALLYLQIVFRELPPMTKVHERLVSKLDGLLANNEILQVNYSDSDYYIILSWVAFVRAAASPTKERCLAILWQSIPRWKIKESLRQIAYRDKICDKAFERIRRVADG